jgi:hypothetical protein
MALSRIKSTFLTNAVFPFFKYDGTQNTTLILQAGLFPFYKYDGTYDTISLS